jgi:hypothetical protein
MIVTTDADAAHPPGRKMPVRSRPPVIPYRAITVKSGYLMTLHLRPETEARLEAYASAVGMSVDEYLEALVEKELTSTEAPASTGGQFQKEHGIWVYRTGTPMPPSLAEDTLNAIRREREARFLGTIPR